MIDIVFDPSLDSITLFFSIIDQKIGIFEFKKIDMQTNIQGKNSFSII